MKKVALHTFGCKLNFAETSTIGNQFLKNDFQIVDYKDSAMFIYLILVQLPKMPKKNAGNW